MEIWKSIKGYENVYEISSLGRVRSSEKETIRNNGRKLKTNARILKTHKDHNGYVRIVIFFRGSRKTHKVHRLVAEAFLDNPESKLAINHKNNDRSDNRLENLEWCTQKENMEFCKKQNRLVNKKGEEHASSVLTEIEVLEIRRLYSTGNYTTNDLGEKYNVNFSTISDITRRKTWKHI